MICARRTSPAPSFCERVIRISLCASSSLNPRTRSVIATSPAWTRAPCNAPDPEKSYPTCRMHHLVSTITKGLKTPLFTCQPDQKPLEQKPAGTFVYFKSFIEEVEFQPIS